jgi:hypothetical protein
VLLSFSSSQCQELFRIASYNYLVSSERAFYYKGNLTSLRRIVSLKTSQGKSKENTLRIPGSVASAQAGLNLEMAIDL